MKTGKGFSVPMAELRLAASAISPDASLISKCERYISLVTKPPAAERRTKGETSLMCREVDEEIALRRALPGLRPVTVAGRRAKAQAALASLEGRAGTQNRLVAASLLDYLANDTLGRSVVPLPAPDSEPMLCSSAERELIRQYRQMAGGDEHKLKSHIKRIFEKPNTRHTPNP